MKRKYLQIFGVLAVVTGIVTTGLYRANASAPKIENPGYPPKPTPTVVAPTKPYKPGESHPIENGAITPAMLAQVENETHLGRLTLDQSWQITDQLQISAAHYNTGRPTILWVDGTGTVRHANLPIIGAPGPASIVGVKGDWVLLDQGLGYLVFNIKDGSVSISDQNGIPGKGTKLYK